MKFALTAVTCAIGLIGAVGIPAYADSPPPPPAPAHNDVCIDPSMIDSTTFPDNKTILFHMTGGKVRIWRNDLPRECPGLTFERGIAYEIRGGEICSNMQVVYVINRWTPCFLGPFTPYTPPSAPPAH